MSKRLTIESLEIRRLFARDLSIGSKSLSGQYADGEVLIQFVADTPSFERQLIRQQISGVISESIQTPLMRQVGVGKLERISLPTGMGVDQAIEKLKHNSWVAYAEPNYLVRPTAISNDPSYVNGSLWGMYSDDLGGPIGPSGTTNAFGSQAEKAWARGLTGNSSVVVGVIDQGIQVTHPDLIDNIWVNPFENPNDGIDNDGNGYIDDKYGWDFLNNDNSVFDGGDAHGTHVAGTIGATGGNSLGVVGVNWDVSIIAAKFIGPSSGTVADAVEALDYLTDLKVRHGINLVATSNSWGSGEYSQALHDAILRSAKQDILFVAAAGNSAKNNDVTDFFPADFNTLVGTSTETAANYDAVISVAATRNTGTLASFSNFGNFSVDIAAPGEGILSTVPNGYGTMSGTSMATPHVTGAIALLASTLPQGTDPSLLRNTILRSATPSTALSERVHSGGFLNVHQALMPRNYLELDQSFYSLSQSPSITVSHPAANLDPEFVESITVEVSTTSSPQSKSIVLTETSASSGIFQGQFEVSTVPTQEPGIVHANIADQIKVHYPPLDAVSFATLESTQGFLVEGTPFSDTIVATFTGSGTVPSWRVSVNGSVIFNGQIPGSKPLFLGGLDGNDTLIVQGSSLSDAIEIDGQSIKMNGWESLASSVETFIIQGLAGDDSLLFHDGSATFDGGLGNDQVGSNVVNNSWSVSGQGGGNLNNQLTFTNIESLLGSSGIDQFNFGAAGSVLGQINGGLGDDRIDFSNKTTAVTVNLNASSCTFTGGISGVESVIASAASNDLLIASNVSNQWVLNSVNSGSLNSGVISGGTGVDVVNLLARTSALEYRLGTTSSIPGVLGGYSAIEQMQGNSVAGSRIVGSNVATTWGVSNTGQVVVSGVTYFGVDTLVGGTASDTLTGPALATTWTVSSANAGSLASSASTINFSGVENLTGNTLVDTFVIGASGSLIGVIRGGTGVDVVNLLARTSALEYRLGTTSSIPGVLGGYSAIEQMQGNSVAGSRIVGSNVATTWGVGVSNTGQVVVSGVTYFGVDTLAGGTALDTLTGPALATTWTVSSANAGSLASGASTINFSGVENLTGNTLEDSFEILPNGSLNGNLSGGLGGMNSISYAQWTLGVIVDLSISIAGNSWAIGGITSLIQMITGGIGNDNLRGAANSSTILVGLSGDDILTGGSQRDLLFGGFGSDVMFGAGADDLLVSGTTLHDTNRISLTLILSEWTSARTFAQRTANLYGSGTGVSSNGGVFLNSDPLDQVVDTVFSDEDLDTLTGGLNQDWFFAVPSEIIDFVGTGSSVDRRDG